MYWVSLNWMHDSKSGSSRWSGLQMRKKKNRWYCNGVGRQASQLFISSVGENWITVQARVHQVPLQCFGNTPKLVLHFSPSPRSLAAKDYIISTQATIRIAQENNLVLVYILSKLSLSEKFRSSRVTNLEKNMKNS